MYYNQLVSLIKLLVASDRGIYEELLFIHEVPAYQLAG